MANTDRPNGFRPVKTISGAPVSGLIRSAGVTDNADIFVGDPLTLTSGLAARFAVEDACLGVAVGFGKVNSLENRKGGAFGDPGNANAAKYYDDSASTHTEWVVYYVPAEDVIFEAQSDGTTLLALGEAQDVTVGTGNATTGISEYEINDDVATNDGDVVVVEIPDRPDNTVAASTAAIRYWVKFVNTVYNNA